MPPKDDNLRLRDLTNAELDALDKYIDEDDCFCIKDTDEWFAGNYSVWVSEFSEYGFGETPAAAIRALLKLIGEDNAT